jgi:nitrite reductase/ring-hydroxylating ferredoxin subunit
LSVLEENEFIPVLEESELAEGSMKGVNVDGTPVLLVKKAGHIYAFDDRCPHQQCQISHGTLDGLVVVCPCHDWRFSLETGEYEEEPAITLKSFESKVEAGKIWVKVEESPQ